MQAKARSPITATPQDNVSTTLIAYLHLDWPSPAHHLLFAGSVPPSSAATSIDRSPKCTPTSTPTAEGRSPISPADSTGNAEDCFPYWNDFIAAISSSLWLPTGTDWPGSALNSSSGWSSKTAAQSWFSTSRMPAPRLNSPRIYSPSCIRSAAGMHGLRRYRSAIAQDQGLSEQSAESHDVHLVGREPVDLQPDG